MNQRTLTINELAEELDLAQQTIRRYVSAGMPCDKGQRNKLLFDPAECAAWMKSRNLTGQLGRAPEEVSAKIKAAQLRKLLAMAGMHELKLSKEKALVVARAEVESANVAKFQAIRTKLLGLPSTLAPVLVGREAQDIQTIIDQYIRDVLQELSRA